MTRRIVPRYDVCMACGLCQVNCIVAHSVSKDTIKAYKTETPRAVSRTRVERRGALSFALSCRHCEDPVCVYSCLTGAMQKDPETGLVYVDTERCVGCWTCVMVCPFGAVVPDLERKKVFKCDLCPDLEVPACVAGCPNQALRVVDSEEGEEAAPDLVGAATTR